MGMAWVISLTTVVVMTSLHTFACNPKLMINFPLQHERSFVVKPSRVEKVC